MVCAAQRLCASSQEHDVDRGTRVARRELPDLGAAACRPSSCRFSRHPIRMPVAVSSRDHRTARPRERRASGRRRSRTCASSRIRRRWCSPAGPPSSRQPDLGAPTRHRPGCRVSASSPPEGPTLRTARLLPVLDARNCSVATAGCEQWTRRPQPWSEVAMSAGHPPPPSYESRPRRRCLERARLPGSA